MVLTRRAAAVKAAEEAAAEAASANSSSSDPPSKQEQPQAPINPNPSQPVIPASVPESKTPDPYPHLATDIHVDSDVHVSDIVAKKPLDPIQRYSIVRRLFIGHVTALVTVLTLAHAATMNEGEGLKFHALVLVLCALPLRFMLALVSHSVAVPTKSSGMQLALMASMVFASNALHLLATRVDPERMLMLMGSAAVDICAAWLRMTVLGKKKVIEPFALIVALVYGSADIFLGGVIARMDGVLRFFVPFLVLRFLFNIRLVIISAMDIVHREQGRR